MPPARAPGARRHFAGFDRLLRRARPPSRPGPGGGGPAPGIDRRRLALRLAGLAAAGLAALPAWRLLRRTARRGPGPGPSPAPCLVLSARPAPAQPPFRPADFGIVGLFDVDWIAEPRLERLLDHAAASPGGVTGLRFFGALTSGDREDTVPSSGGRVWPDPAAPMDFSATLDALAALTARGLTPFVVLSFSPPALAAAPADPPASLDGWRRLVRAFLDAIAADPRLGPAALRDWWFEVWNEPNFPWFWSGGFDAYLDLYRATAEAVRASGHDVRLGGPALAYLPPEDGAIAGAPLMRRFLRFLAGEPEVRCDFLSFHAKGTWKEDGEPSLARSIGAAEEVARLALAADPARFRGVAIVNDEADMRVGFDRSFMPRTTEQFPAWLAAQMVAYDGLNRRYADVGLRFLAASDNANQHLVRAPFDGRRSLLTMASASPRDLIKLAVFHFYELLRLLGSERATVLDDGAVRPSPDVFHLTTVSEHGVCVLLARYESTADAPPVREIPLVVRDLPWERVNVARFQIDGERSNAYAAAGDPPAVPDAATARRLRERAELALGAPLLHGERPADGAYRMSVGLAPFQVTALWITPFRPETPTAPAWLETTPEDGNVILRWQPSRDPALLSYEVLELTDDAPPRRLSPWPLRGALWVETAPAPGAHRYAVRAVSASGVPGPVLAGRPVRILAPGR